MEPLIITAFPIVIDIIWLINCRSAYNIPALWIASPAMAHACCYVLLSFYCNESSGRKSLMVSNGSGISPTLARQAPRLFWAKLWASNRDLISWVGARDLFGLLDAYCKTGDIGKAVGKGALSAIASVGPLEGATIGSAIGGVPGGMYWSRSGPYCSRHQVCEA